MQHIPRNSPNFGDLAHLPEARKIFEPGDCWLFDYEHSVQSQHHHDEQDSPDGGAPQFYLTEIRSSRDTANANGV